MPKPKFVDNSETNITCPTCEPVVKLKVKTNSANGHQFLSCPNYPACTHTQPIPEEWIMRANKQPELFD